MSTILHRITIRAPLKAVVDALTIPHEIAGWFSDKVSAGRSPGSVVLDFHTADGPFHWKIEPPAPSKPVARWTCLSGPGTATGTTATFTLSDRGDGRVVVELDHEGFEDTDEKLRVCNTLWGGLMMHLRDYVQTRTRKPALH